MSILDAGCSSSSVAERTASTLVVESILSLIISLECLHWCSSYSSCRSGISSYGLLNSKQSTFSTNFPCHFSPTQRREVEEKWRVRVFPLPVMQPMEWCPITRALVEMWPCMRQWASHHHLQPDTMQTLPLITSNHPRDLPSPTVVERGRCGESCRSSWQKYCLD